ncbi:MAG: hypothetical protein JWM41_2900 [Gemmatimonadetes bacterium]|nr:hypothetical protein [Gemmatimonadota bacterium]
MRRFFAVLTLLAAACVSLPPQVVHAEVAVPSLIGHATALPLSTVFASDSVVRTVRPASPLRTAPLAVPDSTQRAPMAGLTKMLIPLAFAAVMGVTVKTASADKDSKFASDTVRVQHNFTAADLFYFMLNGVLSTTVATQPACARATTASQVKTTNATVLREAGAAVALAATDNYWTLTGGNLAAGFFRRYLLLDTAGVASVQASTDAATKAGCLFASIPANGTAIVGILTIQNVTNPFIPGTTLLSATGVTDTYIDNHDGTPFQGSQVTP